MFDGLGWCPHTTSRAGSTRSNPGIFACGVSEAHRGAGAPSRQSIDFSTMLPHDASPIVGRALLEHAAIGLGRSPMMRRPYSRKSVRVQLCHGLAAGVCFCIYSSGESFRQAFAGCSANSGYSFLLNGVLPSPTRPPPKPPPPPRPSHNPPLPPPRPAPPPPPVAYHLLNTFQYRPSDCFRGATRDLIVQCHQDGGLCSCFRCMCRHVVLISRKRRAV